MKDLKFRVWYIPEKKMYPRGYQKLTHVLLCEDDHGASEGRGKPVKRVSYDDCVLLESTAFRDKHGIEIFEGDKVRVCFQGRKFEGVVDAVPDMFGSKNIHPLESVLKPNDVQGNPHDLDVEVIGNVHENQ